MEIPVWKLGLLAVASIALSGTASGQAVYSGRGRDFKRTWRLACELMSHQKNVTRVVSYVATGCQSTTSLNKSTMDSPKIAAQLAKLTSTS